MNISFQTEECRRFWDAWRDWRGDRLLPEEGEIIHGEIEDLLAAATMVELVSAKLIVFRLAGAAIQAAFGRDITGENFLAMADPDRRAERYRRTHEIITQPCGAIRVGPSRITGFHDIDVEFLSLPIASNASGLPSLILTLAGVIGQEFAAAAATDPGARSSLRGFAFVDIGAGLPEERGAGA